MMLGAALLVVAGVPKLTGRTTVPWLPEFLSRPAGLIEVLAGAWALLAPSALSARAVSLSYGILAVALVVAIARREPDCGCFGVTPVTPQWDHLVVNLVLCASAAVAATQMAVPPGGLGSPIPIALALLGATLMAELLSTGTELRRLRLSLQESR